MDKYLRPRQLAANLGTCKATIYRDVSSGLLPPPIKLGRRASAWPESEIIAIMRARAAGKSTDAQRDLVQRILAARQEAGGAP